jgi:hypothetical protein
MNKKIKELLIKHGFNQSTLPNEFKKSNSTAVIWRNNHVTITRYTPNTNRFIDNCTYSSYKELKFEMETNYTI